jgi:hypothetical protein
VKALLREEDQLCIPCISIQRPAMRKHDGLSAAEILVEELHAIMTGDDAHDIRPVVTSLRRNAIATPG